MSDNMIGMLAVVLSGLEDRRVVYESCKKAARRLGKPEKAQELYEVIWPEVGPTSVNGNEREDGYEPDLDHIIYEMERIFA
jgi:hypothetical protein